MQYVRVTILALLAAVCLNAREVTAGIYIVVQYSTSAAVRNVAVALHNVNTGWDYPAISECCVDHPVFYQLGRELYLGQMGFARLITRGANLRALLCRANEEVG